MCVPRLPVDGKKVQELRITLGTKERQLLEDISASYRLEAITGKDSFVESFSDSTKLIGLLGTIGLLLELLGITDVFNFDDELMAKADEIKKKIREKAKENTRENVEEGLTPANILLNILTPGLTPFRAAGFGADTLKDTIEDLLGGNSNA